MIQIPMFQFFCYPHDVMTIHKPLSDAFAGCSGVPFTVSAERRAGDSPARLRFGVIDANLYAQLVTKPPGRSLREYCSRLPVLRGSMSHFI
jgi:hypothetical protein